MPIHLNTKVQIKALIAKKTLTKGVAKVLKCVDVFSSNLAMELPKPNGINNHAIVFLKR